MNGSIVPGAHLGSFLGRDVRFEKGKIERSAFVDGVRGESPRNILDVDPYFDHSGAILVENLTFLEAFGGNFEAFGRHINYGFWRAGVYSPPPSP